MRDGHDRHTTNYYGTFITVSPDCKAVAGTVPAKAETIAGRLHALIAGRPYELTSDDVLFEVFRQRSGVPEAERDEARAAFFAKPQACLRACPLVKQFGWGIHHDAKGRIAVYGVETAEYQRLARDAGLKIVAGIRSSKVGG
jgi:hypothetical protein